MYVAMGYKGMRIWLQRVGTGERESGIGVGVSAVVGVNSYYQCG